MLRIHPYLGFDGTCGEAFRFYERVLGGTIEMVSTFGEAPGGAEMPDDQRDRVMHVTLRVGDFVVMGSDAPTGYFRQPQGFHVSVNLTDAAEGARIFGELSAEGAVTMPYEKTFWADGFGMCVDRFGTPWMVNATQPA